MPVDDRSPSLAVLIDADNTSARYAHAIFEEIAKLGEANVRRIYGDFAGPRLAGWNEAIQLRAILQTQQRNNTIGKNAADIALVIDAMDLMHNGKLDGVCLISSDSDFTRLAQRLREEGLVVYGFGERKTPEAYRNACNQFIYVENLIEDDSPSQVELEAVASTLDTVVPAPQARKPDAGVSKSATTKKPAKPDLIKPTNAPLPKPFTAAVPLILKALKQIEDDDGWYSLAVVGSVLRKLHPDFDPRTYGCGGLSDLAEKTGQFVIEKTDDAGRLISRKPLKAKR